MSAATAVLAEATTASSRIPPGQSSPTPPHTPPPKAGNWQHGPPGSPTTTTARATTTSPSHGSTDVDDKDNRTQGQLLERDDRSSTPTPGLDASRHVPLPPPPPPQPCPRDVGSVAAPFALILEAAERVSAADQLREATTTTTTTTTTAQHGTVATVGTIQPHDNHHHHHNHRGSIDHDARLAATADALSITVGHRLRGSEQSVLPSSLVGGHLQPLQQLHRRAHSGSASTMSSTAIDTSPSVSAPSTSADIASLGNPAALTVVPASHASGHDERKPGLHPETPNHRSLKRSTPTSFSERENPTITRIDPRTKSTAQIRSVAGILARSSSVSEASRLGGTVNHQLLPASETRDQNDRGEYRERAVSMYQRQLPPPVPRRSSDSPATPANAIGQYAKETRNDGPWTPLLVAGASNHPISHMRTPTANPQRSPEPEPLQNHREYHYTHQPPHQQQHPPSLPPLRPHTHNINSPPTQQLTPSEVDSSSHARRASEFSPADSSTSSQQSPSKRRRSSAEKPNKRARGPQEHICDECGRKFPYASKLRDHMMIHSPNKDCRCPVPDCTKIFKRPREVSAHCRAVHKNVYRSPPPPPSARGVSSTRLEDTTPTPTPPNSIATPPVPRFDHLSPPRRYQSERTDVIQQQPTPNSDGPYEVRSPPVHIKSDPEDGDRQLPAPDRRIEYEESMGIISPRRDSIVSFRRLSLVGYSSPASPQAFLPPADDEDMSVELPPIPEAKSMQSPSTKTLPGISELANLPRPQIRRPPETRLASIDTHMAVPAPPPKLIDQDMAPARRSASPKPTPALPEVPPPQDNMSPTSPPPAETPTSSKSSSSDPGNPKNPEAKKINEYLFGSLFDLGDQNMGGQTG